MKNQNAYHAALYCRLSKDDVQSGEECLFHYKTKLRVGRCDGNRL